MPLHPTSRHWGTHSLQELVEEVYRPLEPRLSAQNIQTVIDIPETVAITADRELFRRAVHNLMLNALDAMPQGGLLVVTSVVDAEWIELEIADTGPSLTEEQCRQAFDLHPTSQRVHAGWGLAVVHRIVELHHGSVTAMNCPEGGVAFTLRIPKPTALEAAA